MESIEKISASQHVRWHNLLFICLISFLISVTTLSFLPGGVYWWTYDSAYYIEAARSFLDTGQFLVSPFFFSEQESEVISRWPPGYPTLIAFVSVITGFPAEVSSYLLSWLSWFLLAPAILIMLTPVIGTRYAAWVAILTTLSPGAMDWGWRGVTEIPFLTIAILSIGLLIRSSYSSRPLRYAFAGGLFAGLAYTFRNVGIALLLASLITYFSAAFAGLLRNRQAISLGISFCLGASIFVLPLLWFNASTFASVQPYQMPPSNVGLLTNIQYYIGASIIDITGIPISGLLLITEWIGRSWWTLVIVTILLSLSGGVFFVRRKAILRNYNESLSNKTQAFGLIALSLYVVLGAATVITARTVYEMGGMITTRFTMQYSWAILSLIFLLIAGFDRTVRERKYFIMPAFLFLLLGHTFWAWNNYWSTASHKISGNGLINRQAAIYSNDLLAKNLDELSKNYILVSNFADVLRIKTHLRVQQLLPRSHVDFISKLEDNRSIKFLKTNVALILFLYPENQAIQENQMSSLEKLGFSKHSENGGVIIFTRPR